MTELCSECSGPPITRLRRGMCRRCYNRDWAARRRQRPTPCACGCGELTRQEFANGHNTRTMSREEQSRRAHLNTGDTQRAFGDTHSAHYRKLRGRHEHRVVAEKMLGRPLLSSEIVHHRNEDKRDNRPENLEVMTRADHIRHHLHSGKEED